MSNSIHLSDVISFESFINYLLLKKVEADAISKKDKLQAERKLIDYIKNSSELCLLQEVGWEEILLYRAG